MYYVDMRRVRASSELYGPRNIFVGRPWRCVQQWRAPAMGKGIRLFVRRGRRINQLDLKVFC